MTLSQAIRAADGGPIRLANDPDKTMKVMSGKFFDTTSEDLPQVALTLDQIESDQWEYEKKTWEGKAPRAKKDEVK